MHDNTKPEAELTACPPVLGVVLVVLPPLLFAWHRRVCCYCDRLCVKSVSQSATGASGDAGEGRDLSMGADSGSVDGRERFFFDISSLVCLRSQRAAEAEIRGYSATNVSSSG